MTHPMIKTKTLQTHTNKNNVGVMAVTHDLLQVITCKLYKYYTILSTKTILILHYTKYYTIQSTKLYYTKYYTILSTKLY